MQMTLNRHPERAQSASRRIRKHTSPSIAALWAFTQDAWVVLVFLAFIVPLNLTPFSIMLDPAGDAQHAGRMIDDCFERGLTLQFCQALKKELEKKQQLHITLTRIPGDTLEPLQNANFANRLGVHLYVSFHFFHEPEERSTINLYQYVYNPTTDFWSPTSDALRFVRFDEAHKTHIKITQQYAHQLQKSLSDIIKHADITPVIGLPFKPLLGITAPAIGIEISLKNRTDWQNYISGVAEAIGQLFH